MSLLDPQGKELQDEVAPLTASVREKELQSKLQDALGRLYGSRVHAVVNVEFDTSKEERRQYTPGSVEDKGLVRTGSQFFREVLGSDKQYNLEKEAINYKYSENSLVSVRMEPKIERITATVMVDGANNEELEVVRGIVKGSIGIDDARANQVFLSGIPWNHKPYENSVWQEEPLPPVEQIESAAWATLAQGAGLGLGLCLLGLVGAGLLKRRTNPTLAGELKAAPAGTLVDIVSHHQTKGGERTTSAATAANSSRLEDLEHLVSSRPERVASLLRTTWLQN